MQTIAEIAHILTQANRKPLEAVITNALKGVVMSEVTSLLARALQEADYPYIYKDCPNMAVLFCNDEKNMYKNKSI